jgi:DNA-directed RNA polymerase subunit L
MFTNWLLIAKKISAIDKTKEEYERFRREFNTMQIKRCYLLNDKKEPYSFDFTVESVGPLDVEYIIHQACQVAENKCIEFTMMDKGRLPEKVTVSPANTRIIGFDFLIRNEDHTLGNLLQTWLVENHIEGTAEPRISYAGYSVPHPLRDEIILRIGVDDGDIDKAKSAIASAAKGCAELFRNLRMEWEKVSRNVPRSASQGLARGASASTAPVTVRKLD